MTGKLSFTVMVAIGVSVNTVDRTFPGLRELFLQ